MAGEMNNGCSNMRKLPLASIEIPRLSVKDPQVKKFLQNEHPVVITESDLVSPALKWDLDFLERHMHGKHTVYHSKTPRFMYYDAKKLNDYPEFDAPMWSKEVTFAEFRQLFDDHEDRRDEYIYYQQQLTDQVDDAVHNDFLHFNWAWLMEQKTTYGWGQLTGNLMLISHSGNYTPCHYDEQQNLFTMTHGRKRLILFPPKDFDKLYPHQVAHPCDRQSQVDIFNPDLKRFPKFKEAQAYECIVGPGEVLYIPIYWWHNVESVGDDYTISITFWFRSGPPPSKIEYPLSAVHKVSVSRNIEKMLCDALGSPKEIGPFLRTMVEGRYDLPDDERHERKVNE